MTSYPNRKHETADKAARRRALTALNDIEGQVMFLRNRIERDTADEDITATLAERTADVIRQVAVLGALREVREWHAADKAEEAATAAEREAGQ